METPRGTIAYRAPFKGMIYEDFTWSKDMAWDFLCKERPGYYARDRGRNALPDRSANDIVRTFFGDWVLMLDQDHVFTQTVFADMVDTFYDYGLDILVGFTQMRLPPYHPVLYKTDFSRENPPQTIFPHKHEFAPIPIDSSGAACLMVRRKVFEGIKDKVYQGEPFDRARPDMGEDASFFMRAKAAGFQAWCAPWIEFHHLYVGIVTKDMIQYPPETDGPHEVEKAGLVALNKGSFCP